MHPHRPIYRSCPQVHRAETFAYPLLPAPAGWNAVLWGDVGSASSAFDLPHTGDPTKGGQGRQVILYNCTPCTRSHPLLGGRGGGSGPPTPHSKGNRKDSSFCNSRVQNG